MTCSTRSSSSPSSRSSRPTRHRGPASSSSPSSIRAVARSSPCSIQRGTLQGRRRVVAGAALGPRPRDARLQGRPRQAATPGDPVEILGFDGVPEAGEYVRVVENDRRARPLAERARPAPEDRALGPPLRHARSRSRTSSTAPGGRAQGAQPGPQGRRLGLARGGRGRDRQAAAGRGRGQHHPPRRRRHQRVRRHARGRLGGRRPRLQRAPGRRRPRSWPTARASRSAPTRSSTARSTSCAPPWRACSSPRRSRTTSASVEVRQTFRASRVGTIAGCLRHRGRVTPRGEGAPRPRRHRRLRGEIDRLRRFNDDVREVADGLRVRHRARELPGRQGRRRPRGLRDAPGRARARAERRRNARVLRRGAASIHLHFPDAASLKGKRKELQPRQGAAAQRLGAPWPRSTTRTSGSARRWRPPSRAARCGLTSAADGVERWLEAPLPGRRARSSARWSPSRTWRSRMAGVAMRRVDEAVREVLSTRSRRPEGPARRFRHRDRRRDQSRTSATRASS